MSLITSPGFTLSQRRVTATSRALLIIALVGLCSTAWAADEPKTSNDKNAEPKVSSFTIPTNALEGRDPFNPLSPRVYGTAPRLTKKAPPGPIKLVVKGISGTRERPFAIINDRTFGIGDEQNVHTANGRVLVKCINIDGINVTIESQGQIRRLIFSPELQAKKEPLVAPVNDGL